MKSPTGTDTANAWMIRTGWVLSRLSSAFMIVDGLLKLLPPDAAFLEELHRLGEAESTLVPLGLLQFACGALYAIPRTAIGQRCLARTDRNSSNSGMGQQRRNNYLVGASAVAR